MLPKFCKHLKLALWRVRIFVVTVVTVWQIVLQFGEVSCWSNVSKCMIRRIVLLGQSGLRGVDGGQVDEVVGSQSLEHC